MLPHLVYHNVFLCVSSLASTYLPDVQWHSLSSEDYWTVSGHFTIGDAVSFRGDMIIDSGTSLIGLPKSLVLKFWDSIGSKDGYVGCQHASSLPEIVVGIGLKQYKVNHCHCHN